MQKLAPKLTSSQIRSLGSYTLIVLDGVNSLLQQVQAAHIPLPPWVSTIVIPLVAGGIMLLSRSLDRSRSGTGSGIVGTPTSAELQTTASEAEATAAETAQATAASILSSPAINSVLQLLLTNAAALDPSRQLALLATVGTHLTEQSDTAAKALAEPAEPTQQMDQTKLLADIAKKADEEKSAATEGKSVEETQSEQKLPIGGSPDAISGPSIFPVIATGPNGEREVAS